MAELIFCCWDLRYIDKVISRTQVWRRALACPAIAPALFRISFPLRPEQPMKNCLKCAHQRLPTDSSLEYSCPNCGAIYAKVGAALAEKARQQAAKKLVEVPPTSKETAAESSNPSSISDLAVILAVQLPGGQMKNTAANVRRLLGPKRKSARNVVCAK